MRIAPAVTNPAATVLSVSAAVSLAAVIAMASASFRVHAADMTDTAKVISSSPIIEKVTDISSDCGREPAYRPVRAPEPERSLVGPIVGGIAGAILGKQVGQGNGNVAATAGGAIAGAVIGDRVGNRPNVSREPARDYGEQNCRRVENTRDVVKGYTVVYRYNGRDATTTLPYNPGDRIAVGVSAIPEGR